MLGRLSKFNARRKLKQVLASLRLASARLTPHADLHRCGVGHSRRRAATASRCAQVRREAGVLQGGGAEERSTRTNAQELQYIRDALEGHRSPITCEEFVELMTELNHGDRDLEEIYRVFQTGEEGEGARAGEKD